MKRLTSHPQTPTLGEAGAPPVEMHPWAALVAVAGTQAATVAQLQRDIVAALETAKVRHRADLAGFEITPSPPEACASACAPTWRCTYH
jgi:tripartite-type tricarboxylate transporter receptor subunit TctC